MSHTHEHPRRAGLGRPCGAARTYGGPKRYHHRPGRQSAARSVPGIDDTLTGTTVSTTTVAAWWGVAHKTIYGHARRWHPNQGHGRPIALTPVEALTCGALLAITGPNAPRLHKLAETAIRNRPGRWLVLSTHSAVTYPSIDTAASALSGPRAAIHYRLIDLWPPARDAAGRSGTGGAS